MPASCLLRATAGSRESIQAEKTVVREPRSQEGKDGGEVGRGEHTRKLQQKLPDF